MYDLIIIGGGPAGYLAAERGAEEGLKVLLFEKRSLGGVCLNEGCIPSKTLLYSAKIYQNALHGEKYGVKASGIELDHKKVVQRKNKVVSTLVGGIKSTLKKLGADVVNSAAYINGRSGDGFEVTADGNKYIAKQLLIATGSSPMLPPIEGLKQSVESGFALTNREILDLTEVPAKLAIIGGGVIGLEMAAYFGAAGSEVTVIEMLDHVGGNIDSEISALLQKNLESKGVKFLLSSKVVKIGGGAVEFTQDGKTQSVPADKVLVSVGRKPNTDGIGIENIGLYTERGAIVTDDMCRTNVAGVYAAGDVNGKLMLAHTAYRETEVAISNMTGKKDYVNYQTIASVIYTSPEVGSVGLTEQQAKAAGYKIKSAKLPLYYSGRYLAENEGGDGFIKLIADADKNVLLGCHIIGSYASEIILSAASLIELRTKIADIKKIVFPHPTVCEIIREAVFALK
jgi:dihydrolipoamide dehydrogenase